MARECIAIKGDSSGIQRFVSRPVPGINMKWQEFEMRI
jgi:hypothetical protein